MSGYAVTITLLILIITYTSVKLDQIGQKIVAVAEEDIPLTKLITDVEINQLKQALYFEEMLKYGLAIGQIDHAKEKMIYSEEQFLKYSEGVKENLKKADALAQKAVQHAMSEEIENEFQSIIQTLRVVDEHHIEYDNLVEEVFHLANQGDILSAEIKAENIEEKQSNLNDEIQNFLMEVANFTERSAIEAEKDELATLRVIIILGVVIILSGLLIAFFSTKKISEPIKLAADRVEQLRSVCITNLGHGLTAIAKGNIDCQVKYGTKPLNFTSQDEVGEIARSVDKMIKQAQGGIDEYEITRKKINDLLCETDKLINAAKDGNRWTK